MKTKLHVRNGKIKKAIKEFNNVVGENETLQIKIVSESKPIQDMITIELEFHSENDMFFLGAFYRVS